MFVKWPFARLPSPRLTLFGRSLLLIVAELAVNAICWIVCGILFGRDSNTRPILSLALLAWTIGLRHALDADHIRYLLCRLHIIDNATRNLMSKGQLSVTCGLFFSLGHSSIVIAVNVAIAISTDVYDRIDGVSRIGGIVGTAVSASFLFIVGLGNSIILWKIVTKLRRRKKELARRKNAGNIAEDLEEPDDDNYDHHNTLMMKILGPIVTFVDRPWKMYPVGVLFGFGFDTASSIALLAVSAIATRGQNGEQIAPGDIVILPLLFTSGMSLIDSVDSIMMLYSYSNFAERSFAIFDHRTKLHVDEKPQATLDTDCAQEKQTPAASRRRDKEQKAVTGSVIEELPVIPDGIADVEKAIAQEISVETVDEKIARDLRVKRNTMSGLSIMLTLMSILVAFTISLIEIMGLIGDNCGSCQTAVNAEDGGGLAGKWWRGWAKANDESGYIGAAIVGAFVFVVGCWYGLRAVRRKLQARRVQTVV